MPSAPLAQLTQKILTADQVLAPYISVFYVALAVTFVLTPVMRMVATYYGVIDEPDNARKVHKSPVAYLGGVAMFLGWICGMAVGQYLVLHRIQPGWPTAQ